MATAGFSSRKLLIFFIDKRFNQSPDLAVTQFRLGLSLELRTFYLHTDDGRQAFSDILSVDLRLHVLWQISVGSIVIDGPGQRGLESDQMESAFLGIDIVGKRKNVFFECIVILNGGFYLHIAFYAFKKHGLMEDIMTLVEIFDKRLKPAFIKKFLGFVRAVVLNDDFYSFV